MKTDPKLHDRLARVLDPLPVEVEERLDALRARARGRELRRRGATIAVAAVVAAIGFGAAWLLLPRDGASDAPPAAAGDSGTIGYTVEAPSSAAHHMALVRGDGTGATVLSDVDFGIGDDDFNAWFPELSPDGRRIAYLVETDGGGARALVVNDVAGGDPSVIAERGSIQSLSWSPDSSRIAYVALSEPTDSFDVFVVAADGSGVERVAEGNWHEVSWSPDGGLLALTGWPANPSNTGQGDLYVLELGTGALAQLTDDEQDDRAPDWSPDGTTIVFARQTSFDDDFAVDLYTIRAAGGDPVPLVEMPGHQGDPVFAPGGDRVVFDSFGETPAERAFAVRNDGPRGTSLLVVTVSTGQVAVLLEGGEDNLFPSSWVAGTDG